MAGHHNAFVAFLVDCRDIKEIASIAGACQLFNSTPPVLSSWMIFYFNN
ncbi:hypothetical protein GJA_2893 [Janthinobacterium agaricidamnosum NBRC 102515 = DSM 9628]|uniref:Uncharacterized protein n=1 Tax=Janthinobacterium agaricidamnosum NBRC 102515 = DSM 9628 TaxID=1349767 RepID=W0V8D7_9BURK|nr:hypothetical protein GJA_2893 [Janthinobacterium agaricidamnosum NBRC 102515 = DSM 9628]